MYAYSLTDLTGRRKNRDRTMIVATVEVNRATFIVGVISAVVSLLPAIIIGAVLGPYGYVALIVPVIGVGAGLVLFDQRQRKGLNLRRYEALWDKKKAKGADSQLFVCGVPLVTPELHVMVPLVVPTPGHVDKAEDIFTRERMTMKPSAIGVNQARTEKAASFL